ncbi:MAG: hypothetical protein RL033_6073 [Pseudomonadota bacterium]
MNPSQPVLASVLRHFRQSPERVFDAFLDPERAGLFLFATPGGQMLKVEIDARVGGRFCFVDRRGGEDVEHTGEYLELDRPRRLVFSFGVPRYSADVDRVSIELRPAADGGCTLTLSHELSPEGAPARGRAQRGWANILDGVARVLGDGAAGRALALVEGGFEWSFEQPLPASPEVVWAALTEPAELERWFAFRIEGPRELGAALRFVLPSGDLPPESGVITDYDPPSVLAYTWGQQAFRWELKARDGGGTQLVLSNTFPMTMKAERDEEASWEHCQVALQSQLAALVRHLEGQQ